MASFADISLESITQRLRAFGCSHPEIEAVFVFGSVASGAARRDSDLDVAVLLREDTGGVAVGDLRLNYSVEIEGLANVPADIVILNSAGPILRHQVLRKGRMVYTADEKRTHRFIGDALVEFYDEIEMIGRMQDRAIRRLIGR